MLDENVEEVIADELRRRGIDVTTAKFEDMTSVDDAEILEHATRQGRVVVSYDDDYTKLAKLNLEHAGIVFIPFRKQDIGLIVVTLAHLADTANADDMKNMLRYL